MSHNCYLSLNIKNIVRKEGNAWHNVLKKPFSRSLLFFTTQQIFCPSMTKVFVQEALNLLQMMRFVSERAENILEKGENVCN